MEPNLVVHPVGFAGENDVLPVPLPGVGAAASLELAPFLLPTPDAIVICDAAGRIVAVNDQFCDTFRYREAELVGQFLEMVLPTRYRADHPAQRNHYLTDPMVRPMGRCSEVRGLRSDGREIPVEVRLRKVSGAKVDYIVASVRDVSEIRVLSEKLKSSNRILEEIASGQPLAKIMSNLAGSLEQAHPDLACAIMRVDRGAQKLTLVAAPKLPAALVNEIEGASIGEGEGSCVTADFRSQSNVVVDTSQHPGWARFRELAQRYQLPACWLVPIRDTNGDVLGLLAAYPTTDRAPDAGETEAMQSAAHLAGIAMQREVRASQLREHETQLRQKQKLEAVGTLAGGVAHEFNNLLQIILGYTVCALQGLDAAEQRHQDLTQVRLAAEHARSLTRQLLSYSRPQSSSRRQIDVHQLVHELQRTLAPLLGAEIDLRVECHSHAPLIQADREQLRQVLMNLCLNARDAMPNGGTIRLVTEDVSLDALEADTRDLQVPGPFVALSIIDTGYGMTDTVRARIFEPFFTTKEVGQGTGLGLSVAYGIVRSHQGAIEVVSEPNRGTTFRVILPTVAPSGGDIVSVSVAQDPSLSRGSETVLVVEDDPRVRGLVSRILSGAGYSVIAAESGEMAMELFQAHVDQIRIAILDISMPRLNGRAVAERIWAQTHMLPTVFLTGYDPGSLASHDFAKRGGAWITKPVEPSILLETVRTCLDARRENL